MSVRELWKRLSFPAMLGLCLCSLWLAVRPKPVLPPTQHVWDFSGCGIGKPVVPKPIDLDGDPEHALLVMAVHYECGGDVINLWQTPRLR